MSSLDFELDELIDKVEEQWRGAYTQSAAARRDLQAIEAGGVHGYLLEQARERLARLETQKARILVQIERLEAWAQQRIQ